MWLFIQHLKLHDEKIDCLLCILLLNTAQKIKFSIKDVSSKCDQIRRKPRVWPHLLEKSLMENFIFCAVENLACPLLSHIWLEHKILKPNTEKIKKNMFNMFQVNYKDTRKTSFIYPDDIWKPLVFRCFQWV